MTSPTLVARFCGLALLFALGPACRAAETSAAEAGGAEFSSRVDQIAAFLPEAPSACGAPLSDRAAWTALRKDGKAVIAEADKKLQEPTPELTDDLYLIFSRTGSRSEYEKPNRERLARLTVFTQAECLTAEGKYLPAIEQELAAILAEKTWTLPGHDRKLQNFKGEIRDIDLGVASRAATVATAISWLGDKLPPALRAQALEELAKRVFDPYRERLRSNQSPLCYWVANAYNWNAVCHAGVVLSALAVLPDRRDRAEIVAGAERFLPTYLSGFSKDGYCDEGLSYWNFGFGHYILVAEAVLRATGGRIDFYRPGAVLRAADFPDNLEMAPGLYPSFGDCPLYPQPEAWIRDVVHARLGTLGGAGPAPSFSSLLLYQSAVTAFPLAPRAAGTPAPTAVPDPLRGWFPAARLLVVRPGDGDAGRLSAALLGNDNGGGGHNHNDVGQFVAGIQGRLPLIDPGGTTYTAATFDARRYDDEMLNSYGHGVPRVAGKLQSAGAKASARVIESSFTPERDRVVMDIASAYAVPELTKLERAFTYSRAGACGLEVADRFAFSTPQTFEEALITCGDMEQESADTLLFRDGAACVRVQIDTGGLPYDIVQTAVHSTRKKPPQRVAIRLKDPALAGQVTFRIAPALP